VNAHLLPIQLETSWFLLEAAQVREVLGAEAWLPIPRARAELPGVIVWRGRAVPLVDLARLVGVAHGTGPSRARTLIIHHERGVAALPVDAAREVKLVPMSELRAVQAGLGLPYVTRELDQDGELLPLIDLEVLLADLERRAGADQHGRE
jgi:chemotaxis signal transduction protein